MDRSGLPKTVHQAQAAIMASLQRRGPYSPEELTSLYPPSLQLHFVQIVARHGERTPVRARFQNTIPTFWAECKAAERFRNEVLTASGQWESFGYKRGLETFGKGDKAVQAAGGARETEGLCIFGELTDLGRKTCLNLGQRIRHLYVDQLGFLPATLTPEQLYLRSTPVVRTMESLQEMVIGLYPMATRPTNFQPRIFTRLLSEENLFPNE